MRNKGEARRFMDEVGYLFEGLEPHATTSLKRMSALELLEKFSDVDFLRNAKAADMVKRAWDALQTANAGVADKVS